jgi:hypothetical protein
MSAGRQPVWAAAAWAIRCGSELTHFLLLVDLRDLILNAMGGCSKRPKRSATEALSRLCYGEAVRPEPPRSPSQAVWGGGFYGDAGRRWTGLTGSRVRARLDASYASVRHWQSSAAARSPGPTSMGC